ncbi:MAG: aminopeptidase [Spirochaetia bacterium]|nr:aminopeptidase [Spirochaetia bacterium]
MNQTLLESYADLVIRKGINLKKGKSVAIMTGPGTYYFARALSKSAYNHGAAFVQVLLDDLDVLASRLNNQSDEQLKHTPAFIRALDYEMCSEGWAYIRIDSTEDRLDHEPLHQQKNQVYGTAKREFSATRLKKTMRHELPWCVVCAPGPRWARQVLGEQATTSDLLEVLKPILLLDKDDPFAAWDDHGAMLQARQDRLNDLHIDSLHFKSPVTDFTIGFTEQARFLGGSETLPDGTPFFANLPTEEIFTTPDRMRANGYVTTTRPVTVLNSRTEEIRLVFKEGEVVDYSAKVGEEIMDAFFAIDEGTRRIGECALVDESSPIAQSGLIFDSILIDENASCHIALGDGYPTCLINGSHLTTEESLNGAGCNTSLMHVDFMIGSKDMSITARTREGMDVQIMKMGHFTF